MKHIHIVNPYGSIAMERMIFPLTSELPKLYEVTTSREVDTTADLNFHAPWHTMTGLEERGDGKHIIMYTHCNPPDAPRLMDACERTDLITCMTFEGRRELVTLGVDPKKLWVIYAAADTFSYRRRLIGIVGNPQPNGRKREQLLLDLAWQYDLSPFQFLFVGDGFENIAGQLKSLGVIADAMIADDNGLRELYQRMDVLLVTGFVEGGPLPLLEAMASGTRVLSPSFGYAADLLDENCIYKDADDLMQKLNALTDESITYHKLARAWSWRDYAAEYALLFGRLLDESVDLYPERGASRYAQLLDIIDELRPTSVVEIGTWKGDRAIQMIQQAAKFTQIERLDYQGFDLFEAQTGEQFRREYSKHGWDEDVVRRRIEASGANVELIVGDTKRTLADINLADLYFVDGGHSEETIRQDAGMVLKIMEHSSKCVAIFDDYYHAGKDEGVGCNSIVDDFDENKFEIKHLPNRTLTDDGHEIGMVRVRKKEHANLSVQMSDRTQFIRGTWNDSRYHYTMPSLSQTYVPRPADGEGELERSASSFGE